MLTRELSYPNIQGYSHIAHCESMHASNLHTLTVVVGFAFIFVFPQTGWEYLDVGTIPQRKDIGRSGIRVWTTLFVLGLTVLGRGRFPRVHYVNCAGCSPLREKNGSYVWTLFFVPTATGSLWASACIGYNICACSSPFWEGGATHVYTVSVMRFIYSRGKT